MPELFCFLKHLMFYCIAHHLLLTIDYSILYL